MDYALEAVAWAAAGIGIVVAVIAIPDFIVRRRRAKEQERAARARRRVKRRHEREQPAE